MSPACYNAHMTTIQLTHQFQHSAPCRITVTYATVVVQFEGVDPYPELLWDELGDVEILASVFGRLPVRVFVQLVPVLGNIWHRREHYREILQ